MDIFVYICACLFCDLLTFFFYLCDLVHVFLSVCVCVTCPCPCVFLCVLISECPCLHVYGYMCIQTAVMGTSHSADMVQQLPWGISSSLIQLAALPLSSCSVYCPGVVQGHWTRGHYLTFEAMVCAYVAPPPVTWPRSRVPQPWVFPAQCL